MCKCFLVYGLVTSHSVYTESCVDAFIPLWRGQLLILYIQNHTCRRFCHYCHVEVTFCIYRIKCAWVFGLHSCVNLSFCIYRVINASSLAFSAFLQSHSVYTESSVHAFLALQQCPHLILYIQNRVCRHFCLLCRFPISSCIYRNMCSCVFGNMAGSTSHSVYTESHMQAFLPICHVEITFCIYRIICPCVYSLMARAISHSVYTESGMQAFSPIVPFSDLILYIQNHVCNRFGFMAGSTSHSVYTESYKQAFLPFCHVEITFCIYRIICACIYSFTAKAISHSVYTES